MELIELPLAKQLELAMKWADDLPEVKTEGSLAPVCEEQTGGNAKGKGKQSVPPSLRAKAPQPSSLPSSPGSPGAPEAHEEPP